MEREELAIMQVKETILTLLKTVDKEGHGAISKDQLHEVLTDRSAVETLVNLDVDLPYLKTQAEVLFNDRTTVQIDEIMDMMLMCRGDLTATVKHIISGQQCTQLTFSKTIRRQEDQLKAQLLELHKEVNALRRAHTTISTAPIAESKAESNGRTMPSAPFAESNGQGVYRRPPHLAGAPPAMVSSQEPQWEMPRLEDEFASGGGAIL
eukprot:gnl/TRDRNA2_/TRDRNA2_176614_c0_seq1.p1 gnl/TRDRNA2_/TRDRNA2_176614_c0~~gnl/TRDRNA2_/TRDRNA2_176614_c0_seq1.p1  ORF type:complete len:226 (+),score=32.21 gnl/TRDRNA2_/TRDRNA2_176614_c0_seq1:56-679(+)